MAFSQQGRLLSITTVLGRDVLLLTELAGEEGISRGFRYELSLLSEHHAIPSDSLLGSNVTVSLTLADGSKRYLNGIISSFSHGRSGGNDQDDLRFTSCRCTLVSWFWTLSKRADIRIFQNRSTPEIVEQVFQSLGFSWYRFALRGSYDKREFCVQYRETAFNFVSRLLEEEGISYFFQHEDGKHTMILADSSDANLACPNQHRVPSRLSANGRNSEDAITGLELTKCLQPTKYSLNDYNFKVPNTGLNVAAPGAAQPKAVAGEIYDAPGCYTTRSAGDRLARIRMEEEEAQATLLCGSSDCRAFASGYRFRLSDPENGEIDDKEFVLVSVRHEAVAAYGPDAASNYQNSFECVPYPAQYRPPRVTPKPVVQGTQTAVVVGPPGEEIHTDQYGRIKVKFHWDREGKGDDGSSCWIRVSQSCAGNGWGSFFLPRVGHEVLVDFLEGDPDRPIVVGQLHNGVNLPPYQLPAEKTKSCIKSSSTPGGQGYNELRFEDKKGEEQLYLHAQREQVNRVNEDSLEWVGQDRHVIVNRDRLEKISRDQHLQVAGDCNERIEGDLSITVGADLQLKVATKCALQAGEAVHIKAAKSVVIESLTQVSFVVGGSFITITPAGVAIVGGSVQINDGGTPGVCTGASPEQPKPPKEAGKAGNANAARSNPDKPLMKGPQATSFERAAAEYSPLCAA